ncbi:GNAT family N-acetyltransferase [uncultured Desulfovibrio sp.]|uniref:GNAT family N-acetyltransferase n=1 Tax=uncultured Desulfovibrio sp. TaxID=167968 RepID=UPI00260153B8|nr:GNAT family N-acetyltransferase [uncultured Desulfovibrio sp.]
MEILKLREHSELAAEAAAWFHSKWDIPIEEYTGSIQGCLTSKSVPQWYVAVEDGQIIGGIGVIENDFHNRRDLTPNVCAVYVEENYRCRGIAGNYLILSARICVHLA